MWDTGANYSQCGVRVARAWGVTQFPNGRRLDTTGVYASQIVMVTGAHGITVPNKEYLGVPVEVWAEGRLYAITMNVRVRHNNSHLVGVPKIAKLRKQGLSVSFK